ncbi:MAG TPA: DUF4149 domain-containing protein [Paucimonas sp.]|nr:DUF4149 domain-containing protein [Paucimonas sp.]
MLIPSARLLIATLWCGSLWTIGYLAAPALFASLSDRVLAGTIAGTLFRIEAWLSLVAGILLIALNKAPPRDAARERRRLLLIVAMLACTLIGYFGLQPFMAALRESAGADGVMASDMRMRFGILHGISSVFYLAESLLAAGLMLNLQARAPSVDQERA